MNPDQQNSETDLSASDLQTVNPNVDTMICLFLIFLEKVVLTFQSALILL